MTWANKSSRDVSPTVRGSLALTSTPRRPRSGRAPNYRGCPLAIDVPMFGRDLQLDGGVVDALPGGRRPAQGVAGFPNSQARKRQLRIAHASAQRPRRGSWSKRCANSTQTRKGWPKRYTPTWATAACRGWRRCSPSVPTPRPRRRRHSRLPNTPAPAIAKARTGSSGRSAIHKAR
jgi:hypothetical protein